MTEAALFAGKIGTEDFVKFKDRVVSLLKEREEKQSIVQNQKENAMASNSYTIQKGDTLTSIAAKTKKSISEIANRNNITNPNQIQVGQSLLL
jgi:LysM repeat protein